MASKTHTNPHLHLPHVRWLITSMHFEAESSLLRRLCIFSISCQFTGERFCSLMLSYSNHHLLYWLPSSFFNSEIFDFHHWTSSTKLLLYIHYYLSMNICIFSSCLISIKENLWFSPSEFFLYDIWWVWFGFVYGIKISLAYRVVSLTHHWKFTEIVAGKGGTLVVSVWVLSNVKLCVW